MELGRSPEISGYDDAIDHDKLEACSQHKFCKQGSKQENLKLSLSQFRELEPAMLVPELKS